MDGLITCGNDAMQLRGKVSKIAGLYLLCFCTAAMACDHSRTQYQKFRKTHACPATGKFKGACPGYVVDHIIALCKGGKDVPENMQWQSKADAKAKDKVECK